MEGPDLLGEDPEIVSVILQYLRSKGFLGALAALEEESGVKWDPHNVKLSGHLETIIADYTQRQLQAQLDDCTIDTARDNKLLEDRGDGHFVSQQCGDFVGLHTANIIGVAFSYSESPVIACSSTDRTVSIVNFESQEKEASLPMSSAVIALDFNPAQKNLLLAGGMDGSCAVVDVDKKATLQEFHDHTKYVVAVSWAQDGLTFASGSHDYVVVVYRADGIGQPFKQIHKMQFPSNVESLAFHKGGLVIGVRDDNYLHFVNTTTFERTKFNMNATGDDHVSFTPLWISFHPSEEYFLVSTDRDRVIMYRVGSSVPVRNFWGAPNDAFSYPRSCWDRSGKYVYSSAQDHKIYCWEVATQEIVGKLEGHTSVMRDLKMHHSKNLLLSGSFDKTVKLWASETS